MLRKVLIGLAVLVALLIVGLVAFVTSFDANRYKPEIENAAREHTGRELVIDGKLSLSIFPNLALAVPRLTLSERGSSRPFASLERARVSVALLPLLAGKVKADTVSLVGLRATIERHADGSTSIDDLTGGPKVRREGAPGGPSPTFASLELGGLDIVDAAITLHDQKDGSTVTLSKIYMKAGRIAPNVATPADATAALDISEPPTHVDMKLSADAISRDASQVRIGKLALDLKAKQADQGAALSLRGPANADIAVGRYELPKLDGSLEVDTPALPQKTLKVALAGAVLVDATAQHVHADSDLRFDESAATLKLDLDGFSAPHIAFDANIDRLNVDRYLKHPSPATATEKAGDHRAQANPESDTKVDLSALETLRLDGTLALGTLNSFGLSATHVKAAMKAAGGRLDVAPLSASLYEGKLNATAQVQAPANRVAVRADLSAISIGPLLRDLAGKQILDGHGNVSLDLTTQGASVGAMRRALNGSASIALHDGAVHGINVAQKLREVRSAITSGSFQALAASSEEKTDFSELSAHFVVRNGVATNHDLQLASPLLRATGEGTVDIGALALDYTAKISVVGTLEGQGGQPRPELKGVTVPLHVSGPFDNLAFNLDWRNVAQQAIEKKATEQLKSRLGTGGKPADVLKGLLGR